MNNYMNLLNSVPSELKKHLRSIENVSEKIIKREWSKTFNNVCLKENDRYGICSIYETLPMGNSMSK